jgi:quinol monooxygenase YgiN
MDQSIHNDSEAKRKLQRTTEMARQLTVIAFMTAKAEKENELGSRLLKLVGPSRKELGCINYHAHQDRSDPRKWVMYENWQDRSDLDHHFTMPYHKQFIADLSQFVEGEIEMHYLDMRSNPAD